jgi:hypothetical protein
MNKRMISITLAAVVAVSALLLTVNWTTSVGAHGEETPTPMPDATAVTLDYTPTYYEHIEPILAANCMNCHTEGEFGHDSFEMDTPEEIVAGAEDIGLVVSTGYMPPWPPGALSPRFLYDRSLSEDEIMQIMAWVEAGAPLGNPLPTDAPKSFQSEPTVEADIVLTMPEPYTPNSERTDDYRCFLLDPGFTQDTFVVGYDILPQNVGVVHHTVLFPATSAQRDEAEGLNGADGKPGWECFGGSGLTSGGPDMGMLRPLLPLFAQVGGIGEMLILLQQDDAAAQLDAAIAAIDTDGSLAARIEAVGGTEALVGLLSQGLLGAQSSTENQPVTGVIGAWVPGSTPTQFPQDTGLLIPAGGFIVMQMHYNTQANSDPDQSQLVLDISDQTDLWTARVLDINGPVEIPCPDGVTGEQCSREVAIAQSGDGSDTILAICGQTLDQYAAQDPTNARMYCDYTVPTSGWAISIMSHMHKLGQTTRTVLNPDTPEELIMIDIPVWDFDWQGNYWFAEPIWLDAGDKIRLVCTYDNSVSRDNPEPRYIVAGEGTNDEMCLNFITMLPAEPGTPAPVIAGSAS